MASVSVWLGVVLVVGLVGLGMFQSYPGATLAGAVVHDASQQDINLCVNDCMETCAIAPDMHYSCIEQCEAECGVVHP
jgi:hypothetical protein